MINTAMLRAPWIVYRLDVAQDGAWTPYYVGCERSGMLLTFRRPRGNSLWCDGDMALHVLQGAASEAEAQTAVAALLAIDRPYLNANGTYESGTSRVRCIDDGMEFDTAAACATYYGASQSALSNHLQRKPGHRTVRNRTFERI